MFTRWRPHVSRWPARVQGEFRGGDGQVAHVSPLALVPTRKLFLVGYALALFLGQGFQYRATLSIIEADPPGQRFVGRVGPIQQFIIVWHIQRQLHEAMAHLGYYPTPLARGLRKFVDAVPHWVSSARHVQFGIKGSHSRLSIQPSSRLALPSYEKTSAWLAVACLISVPGAG